MNGQLTCKQGNLKTKTGDSKKYKMKVSQFYNTAEEEYFMFWEIPKWARQEILLCDWLPKWQR